MKSCCFALLSVFQGCFTANVDAIAGVFITTNTVHDSRVYVYADSSVQAVDSLVVQAGQVQSWQPGKHSAPWVIWHPYSKDSGAWSGELQSGDTSRLTLAPYRWLDLQVSGASNLRAQGYAGMAESTPQGLRLPYLLGHGAQPCKWDQGWAELRFEPLGRGLAQLALRSSQGSWTLQVVLDSMTGSLSMGALQDPRDGRVYRTVRIGSTEWMAQSLNWGRLQDTGALLNAGFKFCPGNDSLNCNRMGAFYPWHRAMNLPDSCSWKACSLDSNAQVQGICPPGWRLPSKGDWERLANQLGGMSVAAAKLKAVNLGKSAWDSIANSGDPYGFSALPMGLRYSGGSEAYGLSDANSGAVFWTATDESTIPGNAWRVNLSQELAPLSFAINHLKEDAMNVRCMR